MNNYNFKFNKEDVISHKNALTLATSNWTILGRVIDADSERPMYIIKTESMPSAVVDAITVDNSYELVKSAYIFKFKRFDVITDAEQPLGTWLIINRNIDADTEEPTYIIKNEFGNIAPASAVVVDQKYKLVEQK